MALCPSVQAFALLLLLLQFKRLQAPKTARRLRQECRFPQDKARFLLYAAPIQCALVSALICSLFADRCGECARATVPLCTASRHAPVTGVPSLALRCARSQAPKAARKILVGAADAAPVPPGPAQVSTPTHPRSNPTVDGEGACLGRRPRLRRTSPSASLRYTNKRFYARTRARMHTRVLTHSLVCP